VIKILTVAANTFRETIRERWLVVLPIYVVLLPVVALAGGYVAVGLERKILIDVGLSLLTLIGILLAIFLGTSLARVEIERGVINFLLARPLRRGELILGKFAGLGAALLVATGGMGAILAIFDLLIMGGRGGGRGGGVGALWPVIGLIYLELLIILALALFFSSFTNQLLAMVLALLLTLIGRSAPELNGIAEGAGPVVRSIFRVIYYLVPDLASFNYIAAAGYGGTVTARLVGGLILYAVVALAVIICATIAIFERRDIR
jgi:ABC-type transport system involved in multi-copper enzyme maturation permease subunit